MNKLFQQGKIQRAMLMAGLLFVLLTLTTCKKRKAFNSEEGQTLADVTLVRSYLDQVLLESNEAISTQFFLRGKPAGGSGQEGGAGLSICAYVVDTSLIYSGKLTFNYSNNVCDNYRREGQAIVSIQNYPTKKWKDKGAILKVEFINYMVTNTIENKSLRFNGSVFITNESGGTFYDLKYLNLNSVIHAISGSELKITFDKTLNVFYNVERRTTYTIKGQIIWASSEGTASQNAVNNIDCWGIDRDEKDFTSRIEKAVVWNASCSPLKPLSGDVVTVVNGKYYDLLGYYGTDSNGNSVSNSGCPYGWKMQWSLRNKTKQRVFNY